MLSPTAYGASVSNSDNSTALNAWLAALASTGEVGIIDGRYRFAQSLAISNCTNIRIEQPIAGYALGDVPYGLEWSGTFNPAATALAFTNVGKVELTRVSIHGHNNVGKLIDVEPFAGSYQHFGVVLRDVAAGGVCYYIGGNTLNNQFHWHDCNIVPNSAAVALQINNPNSVNHEFVGGFLGAGTTGLMLTAGKIALRGVEFNGSTVQDIFCQGVLTVDNCWTENSYRFLTSPTSGDTAPITISGTSIASCPFNKWMAGGGSGAQPDPSDPATFAPLIVNRALGFSMTNTYLQAPYFNNAGFRVQTVLNQNAGQVLDWENHNAYSCLPGAGVVYTRHFYSVAGVIQ